MNASYASLHLSSIRSRHSLKMLSFRESGVPWQLKGDAGCCMSLYNYLLQWPLCVPGAPDPGSGVTLAARISPSPGAVDSKRKRECRIRPGPQGRTLRRQMAGAPVSGTHAAASPSSPAEEGARRLGGRPGCIPGQRAGDDRREGTARTAARVSGPCPAGAENPVPVTRIRAGRGPEPAQVSLRIGRDSRSGKAGPAPHGQ